jgi:hypothetical protein
MEHPPPTALAAAAAFLYPDRFRDSHSAWPFRAITYFHAAGEALGAAAPRWLTLPQTLMTLAYGAHASYERGRRAASTERHPELLRKANVGASLDSALTLWLEGVTLPSIACGAVHRGVAAALPAGASPALLRAAPPAAALALLPLALLPACAHGADALMEWSLRPAIRHLAAPSSAVFYGSAQYVPDMPEEGSSGSGGGGGGDGGLGSGAGLGDLRSLIPSDMDELQRRQLEWALDGREDTIYPEAPAGVAAAAAAASAAAPAAKK